MPFYWMANGVGYEKLKISNIPEAIRRKKYFLKYEGDIQLTVTVGIGLKTGIQ
jgi:hypothetical protein